MVNIYPDRLLGSLYEEAALLVRDLKNEKEDKIKVKLVLKNRG